MRLNLTRFNCVQFDLFSDFPVSADKHAAISALMNQTHSHPASGEIDGEPRTALFGSRTRTKGITHGFQGILTSTPEPTQLRITLSVSSSQADEELPPPPKTWRPVSLLVENASNLFGSISVGCRAVFIYDHRHGYESKITLPIPLRIQDDSDGITHIESAQFSRRNNDELEYRVLVVNLDDSDSLVHTIDFESTVELSLNSVRGLVDRARSISTRLLIQAGE